MRVAITGHTRGIGRAVAQAFSDMGYEIIGFSRGTGYSLPEKIDSVVEQSSDCDIFINNVYTPEHNSQLDLLYRMVDAWRDTNRIIVNIGSRAGENYIRGEINRYAVAKHAQDSACEQIFNRPDQRPKVINIRPGYVDTEASQDVRVPKLSPEDVAKVIVWAIQQPVHIYVSSITLAHWVGGS